MRMRCGGVITILLAMLFEAGIFPDGGSDFDIESAIEPTPSGVGEYVKSNFGLFADKYNELCDGPSLNASYVEFEREVYDITEGYYAYYLDFDGENGHALFGGDYSLLSFSVDGDLDYLRGNEEIVFSETEGFLFATEDGGYGKCGFQYAEGPSDEAYGAYKGAYGNDKDYFSGGIHDPDVYVKDRFGDGYECYSSKRLSGYENVMQRKYAKSSNEGNCTLSAMFGVVRYFRDQKGKLDIPLDEEDYDGKKNPKAYNEIKKAFQSYGYDNGSDFWCSLNMANAFNSAMNSFGYENSRRNSYAYMNLVWSFTDNCKRSTDIGYPSLWNCARGYYGSHSMVVIGYRQYRKECGWWIFKCNLYKNLMIVNDNWHSWDMYFDLDSYGYNLWSEGFGTFLTVRDYAF